MGYQRRVHGDSLLISGWRSIKMIKLIAIVCLAAAAYGEAEPKAEADPVLLYGGYYGHNLGYGYGYPYRYGHYYGKREAEAEPEAKADPALLYRGYYGHHLGYAGHYGYAGYPYAYWG